MEKFRRIFPFSIQIESTDIWSIIAMDNSIWV